MSYYNNDSEIRLDIARKKAPRFWLIYWIGMCVMFSIHAFIVPGQNQPWSALGYMIIPFICGPQAAFAAAFFYIFRIETFALGSKIEALLLGLVEGYLMFYTPGFLNSVPDSFFIIAPVWLTVIILLLQTLVVRIYKLYRHEPYCNDEELTETDDLSVAEETGNKTIYRVRLYIKSTWEKTVSFYIYYSLTFCLVTFISAALDLVGAIAGCLMALVFLSTQAAVTCAVFYILGIERYALGSKIEALVLGMVEGYIMMFGYGVGFINSFMEKLAGDMSFILSPALLTALILLPQGILIGLCRFRRGSRWRGGRQGRL